MKNTNKFSLLFLVIFLISNISAGGLNIIEDNLNITKMFEQDYQTTITIINEESFTFENIHFEEDWATFTPITLQSGENKTISVTINRNEDFNGQLTLRGEHEVNLGQSNKTIEVDIDFNNGLSLCNMDLIVGDKIQWNNKVLDEIILTGNEDFATILEGSNYTKTFNYVEEFDYYAKRNAGKFTEVCKINVQNTQGLGHSLAYDDTINTNIKINYEPTTIKTNFLETEYTINYNEDKKDIFKLENNGTRIAKNIKLESKWIEFSKNNFDLEIGESINIEYTIKPSIYLTNQTNKTYILDLEIIGNFNKIVQDIKIKIPYSSVDSKYTSSVSNPEFMHDLYYFFCDLFPEDTICIKATQSSDKTTTIEYSHETISGLLDKETKRQDEQTVFQKTQLEINQETNNGFNLTNSELLEIKEGLKNLSEKQEESNVADYFNLIIILAIASLFFGYKILGKRFMKDKIQSKTNFSKGEEPWN